MTTKCETTQGPGGAQQLTDRAASNSSVSFFADCNTTNREQEKGRRERARYEASWRMCVAIGTYQHNIRMNKPCRLIEALCPIPNPLGSFEQWQRFSHNDLTDMARHDLLREGRRVQSRLDLEDTPHPWLGERLAEIQAETRSRANGAPNTSHQAHIPLPEAGQHANGEQPVQGIRRQSAKIRRPGAFRTMNTREMTPWLR